MGFYRVMSHQGALNLHAGKLKSSYRPPWSWDDFLILLKHQADPMSTWGECAEEIGRSTQSVSSKASKLGIPKTYPELS